MTDLARYLRDIAGRRFAYGTLDCCTFMADWLVLQGMPDPMIDRRGTYADRRQYRAAIRSEGGIVNSCRKRFSRIGVREIKPFAFKSGDVALVWAPASTRRNGRTIMVETGSICVDQARHALVTPDCGLLIVSSLAVVAAWSTASA